MATAFLRGEFLDERDARIGIRNKAFNYGLGCFGGIRAYWREDEGELYLFRLGDHVRRLVESAAILGLESRYGEGELSAVVIELLRRNGARSDHYVRPILFVDSDELSPTLTDVAVELAAYCLPLGSYFGKEELHACVSSWRRVADNAIPARAKPTGAYLNSALARAEARRNGFDEAIFLTETGVVSEGSACHLFLVRRGELISPPSTADNLDGITRRSLLELARAEPLSLPVSERTVSRSELYAADEVFVCGTAAETTPVTRIDHRPVGSGRVGPVTRALGERFRSVARGGDPRYAAWLTPVYGLRSPRAASSG